MVMYAGQVVELGRTRQLFDAAAPPVQPRAARRLPVDPRPEGAAARDPGRPPDLARPPAGCRFQPRCPDADASVPRPSSRRAARVDGALVAACSTSTCARAASRLEDREPRSALARHRAWSERAAPAHGRPHPPLPHRRHAVAEDAPRRRRRRPHDRPRARSSPSSARAAAARARSRDCWRWSTGRRAGEIYFEGQLAEPASRPHGSGWPTAATCRWSFRTRTARSTPRTASRTASSAGIKLHRRELGRSERDAEVERVLEAVGLVPAAEIVQKFPYELSGGQRQRVGFAQALALPPEADPRRRAGLDARRVDPHRHAQPDERAA